MYFDVSIEACTISTILKRFRRLFLRLRSPGNRKDTRRLRFSFFQQQCQSAGNLRSSSFRSTTLSGRLSDRQTLAPVSPFREAGWFSRSLQISYGGIGAEAPVSLSDWVYRFSPMKVSSVLFDIFQDSFMELKILGNFLTVKME